MLTYKHEAFLEEAINGVLMQQGEFDLELIIGDDCSPDNSEAIVNKFLFNQSTHRRIRYFRHSENIGMMPNFVYCFEKCKGEFIAFCEGDDYWIDNRKLQKQIDFLEKNPAFSVCFCYTKIKNELTGTFYEPSSLLKPINLSFNDFLRGNPAGTNTCTSVFRRELVNDLAWYLGKPVGDWFLWAKLTENNKAIILPFYGGVYRQHINGAWSSLNSDAVFEKRMEILLALKKEYYRKRKSCLIIDLEIERMKLDKKKHEGIVKYKHIIVFVFKHKYLFSELWLSRTVIKAAFISCLKNSLRIKPI